MPPKGERNSKFVWQSAFIASGITGNAGFIGLLLSTFDNGDGRGFFMSANKVSDMTALNEKTVRQNIKRLTESGWLTRTMQGGNRGGRALASEYRLTIPTAQPEGPTAQVGILELQPGSQTHPIDHPPTDPPSLDLSSLSQGAEVSESWWKMLPPSKRMDFHPSFESEAMMTYSPRQAQHNEERGQDHRSDAVRERAHNWMLREEGLDENGEPLKRRPSSRRR